MKEYEGYRTAIGATVVVDGKALAPRLDLSNHSPDGFEWGYGGSGPAQLALALCADVLHDDAKALRVHQAVKRTLVAFINTHRFVLSEQDVLDHIARAEAQT